MIYPELQITLRTHTLRWLGVARALLNPEEIDDLPLLHRET
jgi:hypothetical protein